MKYNEEKKYIGHINQLFNVKEYRLCGGWADGVRAVDVSNGSGLSFTVLVDRAMDIFHAEYKGKNLCYKTPVGIKAPQYFDVLGEGWMHSFGGGFFVTCGLDNIGSCCNDQGNDLPCHGRLSNIPAENFRIERGVENGTPYVTLIGQMSQTVMFGTQLTLTRKITCKYMDNKITVNDTVTNGTARSTPVMILYHFNMGYPLLDENAEVIIPSSSRTPRSETAAKEADMWDKFIQPEQGYNERCYYHNGMKAENGVVTVGIKNKKSDLFVKIAYENKNLPCFLQWKMMGKGEYVCGLEPGNATVDGRSDARKNGTLKTLEPDESVDYALEITVGEYDKF